MLPLLSVKSRHLLAAACACLTLTSPTLLAQDKKPVYVGLDAEFSMKQATAPEAIKRGMLVAMEEINARGGVLGGRRLELVEKDNRGSPGRAVLNTRELIASPDLVAVFTSRFSPAVIEATPVAHEAGLPLLDPWAAADSIIDTAPRPSHVFRLSLRDSWAMPALLDHAIQRKKAKRIGLLLINSAWGRNSLAAARSHIQHRPGVSLLDPQWFNIGDTSLITPYLTLIKERADAVILVANDAEGAALVKEVVALPEASRRPIVSHWGITGGDFASQCGDALGKADLAVVQTFSFIGNNSPRARQVVDTTRRLFNIKDARDIDSPVGLAHAYDLTHILARAIDLAGSADRAKVRDALEQVRNYDGLIKRYARPFTPERHEALSADEVFLARFEADGAIVRIGK